MNYGGTLYSSLGGELKFRLFKLTGLSMTLSRRLRFVLES